MPLGAQLCRPTSPGSGVAVVEDGPTLTHGGMTYGAGVVAARRFGAGRIVDPTPYAVGSIADVIAGLSRCTSRSSRRWATATSQVRELEATLNAMPADVVLAATPIDLTRVLTLNKPIVRVRYELEEVTGPSLETLLEPIVELAATGLAATAGLTRGGAHDRRVASAPARPRPSRGPATS